MSGLALAVVVTAAIGLIAFAGLVLLRPAEAIRFLGRFASSARAHYLEMGLRLVFGTSLIVSSGAMRASGLFRLMGWAIALSSVVLLLLPWQWHQRFGDRIRPALVRLVNVYAAGSFTFGCLLLYGVLA